MTSRVLTRTFATLALFSALLLLVGATALPQVLPHGIPTTLASSQPPIATEPDAVLPTTWSGWLVVFYLLMRDGVTAWKKSMQSDDEKPATVKQIRDLQRTVRALSDAESDRTRREEYERGYRKGAGWDGVERRREMRRDEDLHHRHDPHGAEDRRGHGRRAKDHEPE